MKKQLLSILAAGLMLGGVSQVQAMDLAMCLYFSTQMSAQLNSHIAPFNRALKDYLVPITPWIWTVYSANIGQEAIAVSYTDERGKDELRITHVDSSTKRASGLVVYVPLVKKNGSSDEEWKTRIERQQRLLASKYHAIYIAGMERSNDEAEEFIAPLPQDGQ